MVGLRRVQIFSGGIYVVVGCVAVTVGPRDKSPMSHMKRKH